MRNQTFTQSCDFAILQVESSVVKGKLSIYKKKTDFCNPKAKVSDILRLGLGMFGIPSSCSFNATKLFCYKSEKVVKFSESTMRLLRLFPINGNSAVTKLEIEHATGTSCFETETELVKE